MCGCCPDPLDREHCVHRCLGNARHERGAMLAGVGGRLFTCKNNECDYVGDEAEFLAFRRLQEKAS